MTERRPKRSTIFMQFGWPLVGKTKRIVHRLELSDAADTKTGEVRMRPARLSYRVRIGWLSDSVERQDRQPGEQK